MRQKKDFSWMHSVGDDSVGETGRGRNEFKTKHRRLITSKPTVSHRYSRTSLPLMHRRSEGGVIIV